MIRELFSRDIDRRIEEVIKVDQTDEAILREELEEYVVTRSIKKSYLEILEEYAQRPNNPSDAVGVWVSGFFGSGKSSFAKNLGLALSKRPSRIRMRARSSSSASTTTSPQRSSQRSRRRFRPTP